MPKKRYPEDMYDFETWFNEIKGLIFRIRVYRRVGDWTPYEMEHTDKIPSQYIDGEAFVICRIENAIVLTDGDVLLGIRYLDKDTLEPLNFIEYNKLSNINLVQVDMDNNQINDEVNEYVS